MKSIACARKYRRGDFSQAGAVSTKRRRAFHESNEGEINMRQGILRIVGVALLGAFLAGCATGGKEVSWPGANLGCQSGLACY